MSLTLMMNEDSLTPNTVPSTGRVSYDMQPQRRGLNRTRGNLRISVPSRVLSGAGLAGAINSSSSSTNNNTSRPAARAHRTSATKRPSSAYDPTRAKSKCNSLEDFLQRGMASLQLNNELPQIQKLRASLTRMCEASKSRRRLSNNSTTTTTTSSTLQSPNTFANGNPNRDSFQCSVSSGVGGGSSSDDTFSVGTTPRSSLTNTSIIFGMNLRTCSIGGRKASDRLRASLMGTAITVPSVSTTFLQRCSSYDIDGVDIDEQRRQLEAFNHIVVVTSEDCCDDDNEGGEICEDCQEGRTCLVCCAPEENAEESFGHFPQNNSSLVGYCSGDYLEPEHQQQYYQDEKPANLATDILQEDEAGELVIEVAPGVRMSLKTPEDTWNAVVDGRITVTACTACNCELTCADDAEVVVCTDCWVFSPVDQSNSEYSSQHDSCNSKNSLAAPENRGDSLNTVGSIDIGIKAEAILEWLESQVEEEEEGLDTDIPEE